MSVAPLDRSRSSSTTYDVPRLLQLAREGTLRVPRFQRPIVWDARDVRLLFDSIYRGFPIGTVLLWRHAGGTATMPIADTPSHGEATGTPLVVVDGQQRLTSLVAALNPDHDSDDERFEVYFDLARRRFVGPVRGAAPPRTLPVREALESRRLLAWLRDHGHALDDAEIEVADDLGGALRDYRVPAYIVEDDDERTLREVFDRVNSAGRRMTRAQVFHALFAQGSEPGSPASVRAELRATGFGDLTDDRVVQSLLALRGGDVFRDVHHEFSRDDDVADWYDRTAQALERAIRFLTDEGIPHQLLLPSSLPLPVLAAFFGLHPDPPFAVRRSLRRWLWRGWAHGFGTGSSTPTLRQSVKTVNPVENAPEAAPDADTAVAALLERVSSRQLLTLRLDSFRSDTIAARLVLLALAAEQPLGPDGRPVDIAAALEEHGSEAIGSLVPGRRSEVGARGFWLDGWGPATGTEDPRVLASHGVTPDAAAALRSGDVDGFLARRAEHLVRLTLDHVNGRSEPGMAHRPALSTLIVPDP